VAGSAESVFGIISDVEEAVFVFVFLVHETDALRRGGESVVVEKEKQRLGLPEFDAFADDVHKLTHGEVGRHEVLLFVNVWSRRAVALFDDNRNPIRVLGPNTLRLGLALFQRPLESEWLLADERRWHLDGRLNLVNQCCHPDPDLLRPSKRGDQSN